MTDERITDEMVESAAEAIFNTPVPAEHPVDWDCMPPEITDMVRAKARAALFAVGLPALLERVTERISEDALTAIDNAHLSSDPLALSEAKMRWWWAESEKHRRQRDAHAAKVADAWDEGKQAAGNAHPCCSWPVPDNPYRAALTEGVEQ